MNKNEIAQTTPPSAHISYFDSTNTALKHAWLAMHRWVLFDEAHEEMNTLSSERAEQIPYVKEHPTLEDDPEQDNLLFMTSIPWVSFTSFMHPIHLHPADSVPRFAWGKSFEEGKFLKMPLSVQAHHALMDGIHIGRFYAEVQDYLQQPEVVLGEV